MASNQSMLMAEGGNLRNLTGNVQGSKYSAHAACFQRSKSVAENLPDHNQHRSSKSPEKGVYSKPRKLERTSPSRDKMKNAQEKQDKTQKSNYKKRKKPELICVMREKLRERPEARLGKRRSVRLFSSKKNLFRRRLHRRNSGKGEMDLRALSLSEEGSEKGTMRPAARQEALEKRGNQRGQIPPLYVTKVPEKSWGRREKKMRKLKLAEKKRKKTVLSDDENRKRNAKMRVPSEALLGSRRRYEHVKRERRIIHSISAELQEEKERHG